MFFSWWKGLSPAWEKKLVLHSCSVPFSLPSHLCGIMVGKCPSSPSLLKTCVQLPWSVGSLKHHPPPTPTPTPRTLRTNSGNRACIFSLWPRPTSIEKATCVYSCASVYFSDAPRLNVGSMNNIPKTVSVFIRISLFRAFFFSLSTKSYIVKGAIARDDLRVTAVLPTVDSVWRFVVKTLCCSRSVGLERQSSSIVWTLLSEAPAEVRVNAFI